nr:cyclin-T1-3-like isoform X1 [Ipomoea batatas]
MNVADINSNASALLFLQMLRSSLWLQFKPNQIAAGAAYLAAKILNMNLASNNIIWQEFQTPPNVLRGMHVPLHGS